ncbi:MAG: TetR family transcriptional regulator [Mucilaginibacter sp.]|nr:TetR family transcriptional regulator [Mucilaginibacter sp.]
MGKSERTKQFIIEKAAPIFNAKGIAGTRMEDILDATKLAKGGLYRNFETKAQLSYATVDYLLNKLAGKIESLIASEKTAIKKVFAVIDLYKNPLHSYIDGGCPILNLGAEADDTDHYIKGRVRRNIENSLKMLRDILEEGKAAKEITPEFNAEVFCMKMLIGLEGAMLISRVTNSNKPMNMIINDLKKELNNYIPKS